MEPKDFYNTLFQKTANSVSIPLRTLRLKVTDRCAWNCWFCHNEGSGERNPQEVGDVEWNEELAKVLTTLKKDLSINEIHLTGGEPTAHPALPMLIYSMKQAGFHVTATSIGCPKERLKVLIESGLDRLNFSFHALDAEVLRSTQTNHSLAWSEKQLNQQLEAISLAKELGAEVKLNTVCSSSKDYPRVLAVIEWARVNQIPLRLLPELGNAQQSIRAIIALCNQIGAIEISRRYTNGSSNSTIFFRLPNGYTLGFKFIHEVYLSQTMCLGCPIKQKNQCTEKFYGIRLEKRLANEKWRLFIRLCLHRTETDSYLAPDEFLGSKQYAEIQRLVTQTG
ncbi:radical SAM protein [Candidatus Amarolinea aalborgensis]|uniref:radical SAM protein n=1 Tax=Candidatus Amarolinea aalborgensis TaxID=2249329 RepID=UPI003BFA062D